MSTLTAEQVREAIERYSLSYGEIVAFTERRIADLESLVRDMWVDLCCSAAGFDISNELNEIGDRMNTLGIEIYRE